MENIDKCEFCEGIKTQEIISDGLIRVVFPSRPVIDGHLMIMTVRHIDHYDQMNSEEAVALKDMIGNLFEIMGSDGRLRGYNLLSNNGKKSGQRIDHFHMHFFPRFKDEESSPFEVLSNPASHTRPKLEGEELDNAISAFKKTFCLS